MKIALVIEVPPSSKKSSSTPISRSAGSPRTSWNWPARKRSRGREAPRGSPRTRRRRPPARGAPGGRPCRSPSGGGRPGRRRRRGSCSPAAARPGPRAGRRNRPRLPGQVGHQAPVPLARQDHGLAHAGLDGQRGLDLPQLDAEAADLDLLVDAAEVLEVAVRQAAGEVAACGRAARPAGPEKGSGTKRSAVSSGRPR